MPLCVPLPSHSTAETGSRSDILRAQNVRTNRDPNKNTLSCNESARIPKMNSSFPIGWAPRSFWLGAKELNPRSAYPNQCARDPHISIIGRASRDHSLIQRLVSLCMRDLKQRLWQNCELKHNS